MKKGDPCPCCQCQMVSEFKCGCDDVHQDYCENCGRFTSLPPEKSTEIWEGAFFKKCQLGGVMHRHHPTPNEYMMGKPSMEEFKRGILLD